MKIKRGTEAEWLGVGNEREVMYGAVTFDERSRYFTHSTMLSNVVNAQGNICMYKRLVPADAGIDHHVCPVLEHRSQ